MKGKGVFQLVVLILFIAGGIFGVLVFSGAISLGTDSTKAAGTVVMWGTIKTANMSALIENFNQGNDDFKVVYVEKAQDGFDQSLLEALASGTGPDMFFLPNDLAFHYSNKIFTVPYESYPLVNFKNNFTGAGEVFLNQNGILAFPILVDPIVMYYNRSILDSNAIIYPPKTWGELTAMVPILTKKDTANKINKSAVAFGHFSNVNHAKDILVSLFMQAGNPIVGPKNGSLGSALNNGGEKYDLGSILQFYVDFADPVKPVYSWNKSFPRAVDAFSSEDLAIYFGFASEFRSLLNKNPNQNIGIAPIPQIGDGSSKVTNSKVMGIAIAASSKNPNTAFTAASQMATGNFALNLALTLGVPPARRDLLSSKPKDAYSPILYDSALFAKSYIDPSSEDTDNIFRTMIDETISNNKTASSAISDASNKLDFLLIK